MTCYICGGTGKKICSFCCGTGIQTTSAFGVAGSQFLSTPCPSCTGTGFLPCDCGSRDSIIVDDSSNQKAKFSYPEIVPFEHINGIVPRETSFEAVREFFGNPDGGMIYVDEGTPYYKFYGMAMTVKFGVILSVSTLSSFRGKTPNSLYLGMDANVAKQICDTEYHRMNEGVEDFWVYDFEGKDGRFQLNIRNRKLCTMTYAIGRQY